MRACVPIGFALHVIAVGARRRRLAGGVAVWLSCIAGLPAAASTQSEGPAAPASQAPAATTPAALPSPAQAPAAPAESRAAPPGPAAAASAAASPATSPAASLAAAPLDAPKCPPALDMRMPARGEDRGLLWRLTRGGRTSYLYGTVHVGRPAWRVLGPQTAAALQASDTLALEIDPTDPALLAALEDKTPAPTLPEALNRRLRAATQRACVPLLALAHLHPVLQATTLTVLDARWLGLDPNHSLEMLLAERAKARRLKIVALETAEQQKSVLVPADPAEALAVIEQTLDQLDSLVSRRVLQRLVQAWERGDLDTLERYEQWCECAASEEDRAFLRRLNDERNAPLAGRIAALHAQGRRVFAAVGALHMTGAAALPRLLAEQGFKVERVAFAAGPAAPDPPAAAPPGPGR